MFFGLKTVFQGPSVAVIALRRPLAGPMLNAEQQKRIDYLCEQIEVEKDPSKVAEFARALSDLLEAKAEPLTSPKKP